MTTVESARADWSEGHRRFEVEARDPAGGDALHRQLEVLTGELRRRVGQTFSLAELARAYAESDRWTRAAIDERAPLPRWPLTLSVVVDEAFHRYSRGAVDYAP